MDEKVLMAALAGLLHDVGKVEQRAKDDPWNPPPDARDSGQPVHAAWSIRVADLVPQKYKAAALAGAYHHKPEKSEAGDKFLSKLVALADKLSAGERSDEAAQYKTKKPPTQLISIFNRVTLSSNKRTTEHYLPLAPLSLDVIGKYIEADKKPEPATARGRYDELRLALEAAIKQDRSDAETYLENVLAAMQRYTWCVPSAYYYNIPDVSLYDHSRMTAALAACLCERSEGEVDSLLGAVTRNFQDKPTAEDAELLAQPAALLVGGDISGVQDFIYTITNKGATSALRGRSFYLQALTETAARFVLRELELPYTNLIYGGGGNFYILARASDKDKLKSANQKLSRILYKHHQGDLYVAVAGIPLNAKDFMHPSDKNKPHPLSAKWGELARQVAVVKNRRFTELEENELAVLFTPQGHGGNEETQCVVCGREFNPVERNTQDEKDKGKCAACLSYEDLGRRLRDARFVSWRLLKRPTSVGPVKAVMRGGEWHEVLNHLGIDVHPWEKLADVPKEASLVWTLSDDAFDEAQKAQSSATLIRRLMVNVTPKLSEPYTTNDGESLKAGDIKPFEKLAIDSQGITRLGIFRADVDDLGKLFAEGLGNGATLSRIASLSFAISLFFEGWVGKIAETRNKEHGDRLYAIYSGGDDLFFVGSWDELVEFAWKVNEDLQKYTGGHPDIHLSGGMVLVTEKYPLAKAAQDAEKAEKAAKGLTWWDEQGNKRKKNVFSFLGQPLGWKTFGCARDLKVRLLTEIEKEKRKSVIRKLLENHALYAEAEKQRRDAGKDKTAQGKPQTLYGPWNWRIVYTLNRNLKDKNKPFVQEVSDPAKMEWVGVAARWAELEERSRD